MSEYVLFVDDEPPILDAVKRLFHRDSDVRPLTASGAAEGMDLVTKHVIPVIVSDNRMPGMTGIEFLEWAKTASPDSVRILATGSAELAVAIDSINRGEVFRFISKPWEETQLRQVIALALSRYRMIAELKSGDEAKLLSLAQAIELKDPYTRGHCERVAAYALMIAEALGLPETMKRHIRDGSWLHDCGKIGIPEATLNMPGRLEPQQMAIMKQHPRWSAEVARAARLPQEVVNIALHHHERYNGAGYPYGMSGENIPLEARIVAIADVFDALTTDRPYRKRLPAEKALAVMTVEEKDCYDPVLMEAFSQAIIHAGL